VGEGVEGRVRYRLLETIRQYAREKLVNSEKLSVFRDRHLDWFLDFVEQARPKLFSREQVVMLNHLDAEHDNFRAALAWSMETAVEKGLRLATGLHRFWRLRGYWFERLDWLKKLLAQPEALAPTSTRAYALVVRGDLELSQGEYSEAENSFAESLQIYRQLGDEKGISEALSELARLLIQQGNFLRAGELSQESLELSRKMGDKFQISQALYRLAHVLRTQNDRTMANELLEESVTLFSQMVDLGSIQNFFASPQSENAYFSLASSEQDQGNFERAREVFEEGLAFFRKTGSSHEIAWFLRYLANLSWREGDLARAQTLYQESLQIVQDLKDKYCAAHTLDGLAQVENGKGNYEQAASLARQALNLCEQLGSKPRIAHAQCTLGLAMQSTDPSGAEQMLKSSLKVRDKLRNKSEIAESLEALAKTHKFGGAFERATKLFAAANMLRESISFAMTSAEISESDRELKALRAELGDEAFTVIWDEGRALPLEQGIKLALSEIPV
jgi:tetratricopeptide (TPR) repeat protein